MNIKKYTNASVIERYRKSENLDLETAKEHFNVLKNFLTFSSRSDKPCFPSKQLDEIWHTFILYTKDYYSFCNDGLGKFVHHTPFNNDEEKIDNFQPGYFCYIEKAKMKRKFVSSISKLQLVLKTNCATSCGSGGDCSTNDCASCSD